MESEASILYWIPIILLSFAIIVMINIFGIVNSKYITQIPTPLSKQQIK